MAETVGEGVSGYAAVTMLQHRRAVRRSFAAWCRHRGYEPALHHRLIIGAVEEFLSGDDGVLLIFAPPGSAKSSYASVLLPPWYLANHPKDGILFATHSVEFAERWGRRVRNDIAVEWKTLGITLSEDNKAAGRWSLQSGGEYYAVGAGTGISGYRADLAIIDDPFGSREDAYSETVRKGRWNWYLDDFSARLKPEAKRIIIACLTGDTLVTMADGSYRRLDSITPGQRVISWDGERTVESQVAAVINSGLSQTYLIRTSGTEVRANARHPFLVLSDGGLRWVRTKDLRPGMRIVSHRTQATKESPARSTAVPLQRDVEGCATVITTKPNGLPDRARLHLLRSKGWRHVVGGVTALREKILTACSLSRMVFAPFAKLTEALESPSTGLQTSYPIITTRQGSYAASYATTATGSQDELEIPKFWSVPSSMSEPVTDIVESITPHGYERVYDLTVDKTHNFLANGLWCSNTRWHEEDISGMVLQQIERKEITGRVISIAAIAEDNDVLGRAVGDYLWDDPKGYNYGEFLRARQRETSPMMWSALYQQRPAPEEGDYFKAEWIVECEPSEIPERERLQVYGASDYAVTADGGDFTVHVVVGIDPNGRMYLLDVWRKQAGADQWVEAFCDLVKLWKPMAWAEEQGQIRAGVGPFLDRRQRERSAYVAREGFPTRGDKSVRAQSIRGRMALDKLYVPRAATWWPALRSELLTFPAGKYDDQVDALGLCGQLLDVMVAGREQKQKKNVVNIGYRRLERQVEGFKTY